MKVIRYRSSGEYALHLSDSKCYLVLFYFGKKKTGNILITNALPCLWRRTWTMVFCSSLSHSEKHLLSRDTPFHALQSNVLSNSQNEFKTRQKGKDVHSCCGINQCDSNWKVIPFNAEYFSLKASLCYVTALYIVQNKMFIVTNDIWPFQCFRWSISINLNPFPAFLTRLIAASCKEYRNWELLKRLQPGGDHKNCHVFKNKNSHLLDSHITQSLFLHMTFTS